MLQVNKTMKSIILSDIHIKLLMNSMSDFYWLVLVATLPAMPAKAGRQHDNYGSDSRARNCLIL